jgi:hypothetical protein
MQPLVEKIAVSVATAAMLGGAAFLYDWNTHDDEVVPLLDQLQHQTAEQVEVNRALQSAVQTFSLNQARQTVRVTSRDIAALEAKPRNRWTEAEREQYEQAKAQQEQAWAELGGRQR